MYCYEKRQTAVHPKISVIIATFNRAKNLRYFLDRLENHLTLSGLPLEIVLVDNNSSDQTPEILASYKTRSQLPVRTVREARQGSNHARNAGIQTAKGELLVFTDDDVAFSEGWIGDLVEYMDTHPSCDVVTGSITPRFEVPRPLWLTDDILPLYGYQNFGDKSTDIHFPSFPVEMNMAIRAHVFTRYGGFDTSISRDDKTLMSNDGKLFFYHLSKKAAVVRYIPGAHLYHLIPTDRLTVKWVLRRSFWQGVSDAAFDGLTKQDAAKLTFRQASAELFKLLSIIRGPHVSPRRMYWHWNGLSVEAKSWHAYKFGQLARKAGWK